MSIEIRSWLMGCVSIDAMVARLANETIEVPYKFEKVVENPITTVVK